MSGPDKLIVRQDANVEQAAARKISSTQKEAFSFHMHEYTTLRKEIEIRNQELLKLQVYAVVGTFAVWSWLATSSKPLPKVIWFMPVLLSVLAFTKARTHLGGIFRVAEYLRELEQAVPKLSSLQGWENFIHQKRGEGLGRWSWNAAFWLILIAATIIVPLLFVW